MAVYSRLITAQTGNSGSEIHVAHMHGAGGMHKIDRHVALSDSDLCPNWSGSQSARLISARHSSLLQPILQLQQPPAHATLAENNGVAN